MPTEKAFLGVQNSLFKNLGGDMLGAV